ncbi:MAG: hypothetical protein AAB473_05055 [Patescibacteria group bacterium]
MVVTFRQHPTIAPAEGVSGPPSIPAELYGVRTLGLGPAKITTAPPAAPPQLQNVALRGIEKPRFVADARSELWIMSPDALGNPVVVRERLVAVYIAARVTNFFAGAEKGSWIVEVDLVFAPVTPGKVAEDWAFRYVQDNGELQKKLVAGLYMALSRLPLWPGLIIRFAGGPPMTKADAVENRHQYWIDEDRSPTRVEIDSRRFVDEAREVAEDVYLDAQRRFFTRFTVARWKRRDPLRYRNYQMGKLLAEREDPAELDKKDLEALKTVLSEYGGPVVSSCCAVIYGDDLDARAALESKGRTPVRPTEVDRPARPTYMEYGAEPVAEEDLVPIGDDGS